LDEKCDILNATVAQRSKFIQIIEQESSAQVAIVFAHSINLIIGNFEDLSTIVQWTPPDKIDRGGGQ